MVDNLYSGGGEILHCKIHCKILTVVDNLYSGGGEILRWVRIVGGTSQSLLQRQLIEPTGTDAAMLRIP